MSEPHIHVVVKCVDLVYTLPKHDGKTQLGSGTAEAFWDSISEATQWPIVIPM